MNILVLNAGSSSLKFKLFKGTDILAKGMIEKIGVGSNKMTHSKAVKQVLDLLKDQKIDAIGHRVVHGGEKYKNATLINTRVIKEIKKLCELAPLHNPPNLAGILGCKKYLPQVPQVAVFDTAYYQTLPEKAYLYGLPYSYYKKFGIRRYGFHGTSHKYVTKEAIKLLGGKRNAKIVTCHLGNGSSITASKGEIAIDTSMGFTPLEGLIMGTRCGNLDPAIVFFLQKKLKLSTDEIDEILNNKSGLKGLSEIGSDMREIYLASLKGNKRAQLMIEMLSYQIAKYIGAYAAALNGLHAIVFTAGMGEKAFYVRNKTMKYLTHLGSKIKVFVIPTNEELQIAKETSLIAKMT